MRDAIGGSVTIVIITVFIVVVLAYLAFNVNYTKAFRMKNKIISLYDEYNGDCGVECENKIFDYARNIGYKSGNSSCANGWNSHSGYYCSKKENVSNSGGVSDLGEKYYYKIATQINIEIPIIQNVFRYQYFWITGDTKTFTS